MYDIGILHKKQCNEPIVIHCFNYFHFLHIKYSHISTMFYPQLTNNCAWLMLLDTHTQHKWIANFVAFLHQFNNNVCVCRIMHAHKCIIFVCWKMMMMMRWDKSGSRDSFKISHNTVFLYSISTHPPFLLSVCFAQIQFFYDTCLLTLCCKLFHILVLSCISMICIETESWSFYIWSLTLDKFCQIVKLISRYVLVQWT